MTLPLFILGACKGQLSNSSGVPVEQTLPPNPPVIQFSQMPPTLTNSTTMTIPFTVSSIRTLQTVTCVLDSQSPVSCPNSFSTSQMIDGEHTLVVTATDIGGYSTDATLTWIVDATAPKVAVNLGPSNVTNQTSATFQFTASDNLSGVQTSQCALDTGAFANCTSPWTYSGLAAGMHACYMRTYDKAGNVSTTTTYTWKIDLTAPTVKIVSTPTSVNNLSTASFTFSGTDSFGAALTSFTCSIDGGAAVACNSGTMNYTGLTTATHKFSVTGKSAAGNFSAPATYSWLVDLVAPTTPKIMTSTANDSNLTSASFNFTSTDTGGSGLMTYQCQLDSQSPTNCPLAVTQTYSMLTDGPHTFKVRAYDNAGNVSNYNTFNWTVDTKNPLVTITSGPANPTLMTTASFVFSATDTGGTGVATTNCVLDSGAVMACSGSQSYSGLSLGNHTFTVMAVDQAGNTGMASYPWTVVAPSPTPTPTPDPSPTATPTPIPSPTPDPSASPTPDPSASPSPTP